MSTTTSVAEGERSPFVDLQSIKSRWWRAILDYPVMVAPVVSYVMSASKTADPLLTQLRDVAFDLSRYETSKSRAYFSELLKKCIPLCMQLDVDTAISSKIADDVDRMELGQDPVVLEIVPTKRPRRGGLTFQTWSAATRVACIEYRALFDEIVQKNLGLVWSVVRRYSFTYEKRDVFQVGVGGMMKAVHRFAPELGNQFSTYATHWIRSEIHRYEQNAVQVIRLPNYLQDVQYRIRQIEASYAGEGREATDEDVRDELEKRYQQVASLESVARYRKPGAFVAVSLASKAGVVIERTYADPQVADLDDAIAIREVTEALERLDLRPAMREAVQWMCGMHEEEEVTLREIGETYDLSRARIQQLAKQGMRILRANLRDPLRRARVDRPPERRPPPPAWPRRVPALVMPQKGSCFECGAHEPEDLAFARICGWYQATIVVNEDDEEHETYEQVCPTCVLSEGYLTRSDFDEHVRSHARAFDDDDLDYDCSSCAEIVTQTPLNARRRGWRVRWLRGRLAIACPRCCEDPPRLREKAKTPTTAPPEQTVEQTADLPEAHVSPAPRVVARDKTSAPHRSRLAHPIIPYRSNNDARRVVPVHDAAGFARISTIPQRDRCTYCGGDGSDPLAILRGQSHATCPRCRGSGRRSDRR